MNMLPRVSVILPAYNRADLVGRAIDSVLAQTWRNFELIVVDDCSTDDTRAAMETYRDTPRVRLIFSETNRGGSGARNLGIEHARGDLVAFQDSDDIWLPHKLAAQVAALEKNAKAGLCYCGALHTSGTSSFYIPEPIFERLDGDMSDEILRRNTTSTQTLLIRRTVLDEAGHFTEDLKRYQDWDLMIRVAQVTQFVFLPDPMVVICDTPGNISSVALNDAVCRAAILDRYPELFARRPDLAARNHYIAGRILMKLGRKSAARKHLQAAFRLRPGARSGLALGRALI